MYGRLFEVPACGIIHILHNPYRYDIQKDKNKWCQEQIELSGFVANELSAFSVLQEGSILRTGGERRMFAFLASYSCAGVIHSHSPAAFAEHGGKWLWVTPFLLRRLFSCYFHEFPLFVIIGQFSRAVEDGQ